MTYIQKVHSLVQKIPKGKVTTYGEIARKLKTQRSKVKITPNMVGWALHANKSPFVPCHRVVNKEGRLAPNFAFGGRTEQRNRLLTEGVVFKDDFKVDIDRCLYKFT